MDNNLFQMDDIGLDDTSLIDLLEQDMGVVDLQENEDDVPRFKFDYKYSFACLGFTALTILKADKEVLPIIVGITHTPYIKLFIAEMDAFLEHITVKLNDITVDSEISDAVKAQAEEICNTFQANLNYFKSHYKMYLTSKSYMKQVSDIDFDKYITEPGSIAELMQELTIYRKTSPKYTVDDLSAILQHLIDFKFKQLLLVNLQLLNQIAISSKTVDPVKLNAAFKANYTERTFDDRPSPEERMKYINKYLSLVAFKESPFRYTKDEADALKHLDFPTQCLGMENMLYHDFLSHLNMLKGYKAPKVETFSYYTFFALYNKKLQMKVAENDTFNGLMYF